MRRLHNSFISCEQGNMSISISTISTWYTAKPHSLPPDKWGIEYRTSGRPAGESELWTLRILWLFHKVKVSSNSACINGRKQNLAHSIWYWNEGLNSSESTKSLKKLVHQTERCFLNIDHQHSIIWFVMEVPNIKLECPAIPSFPLRRKNLWIPTVFMFSEPQTVRTHLGRTDATEHGKSACLTLCLIIAR